MKSLMSSDPVGTLAASRQSMVDLWSIDSPLRSVHSPACRVNNPQVWPALFQFSTPYLQSATVAMQRTPPVYALTLDTLASIFQFAVEAGKTARETTNTPLSLSQVCGTWRKSALRHTLLWTNILLGVQGDRSLNRATEFLSRSGTLPVYVTFDMRGLEGETGLKEPVRFLARHASDRLRFLRVEGAVNAVPVRQFLRILNSTLPNLEEFEII